MASYEKLKAAILFKRYPVRMVTYFGYSIINDRSDGFNSRIRSMTSAVPAVRSFVNDCKGGPLPLRPHEAATRHLPVLLPRDPAESGIMRQRDAPD